MKKVLILGAGLIAKPMVEYLMSKGYSIIIASPMKGRADEMIAGNPLGGSVDWSMDDPETLSLMISESDITVSFLPYQYHEQVARVCLARKKPLVTTSYVQPGMNSLHEDAKQAGIIFLNEAGLDPGIDHMSAMRIIDHIHDNGGKVEQFFSLCGALPAPEAAGNPLGYRFSWSPKSVIHASMNNAAYLRDGQVVEVSSEDLLRDTFPLNLPGLGEMEVYPKKDSVSYSCFYGILEAKTVYRGTIRFKGWCETIDSMKRLGMLDQSVRDYSGMSYAEFLSERSGVNTTDLRKGIADLLNLKESSAALKAFDLLGFFSEEKLKYYETTPFEITSDRMISKLELGDTERDMVILQHICLAEWQNGKKEVIRSSMIDFGSPNLNSAISRTISLPAAIAARLILEGKVSATGVVRPVIPEIYDPVIEELKQQGIQMREEWWLPEDAIKLFRPIP